MEIQFEDLVKVTESLVMVRPRYLDELTGLLRGTFNQPVAPSLLMNVLEVLEDKYNEEGYGIQFRFDQDMAFHTNKPIQAIVGDRYDQHGDPIEL